MRALFTTLYRKISQSLALQPIERGAGGPWGLLVRGSRD